MSCPGHLPSWDGTFAPVEYRDGAVSLLDQTVLPHETKLVRLETHEAIAEAIRAMRVRGAPAIGVTAAYGVVLAAQEADSPSIKEMEAAAATLCATRPTAVNLAWALERMLATYRRLQIDSKEDLVAALLAEARCIHSEDIAANRAIGAHGAELLSDNATVLTICNTGALATGGFGTAFGVLRAAHTRGVLRFVYACETRPRLQGARLTAWELLQAGIPFKLLADGAAGSLMHAGEVDAVLAGADRIARNGDTANKIGTYTLAVLAARHDVPFYVVAPTSTIDPATPTGDAIPIEERDADEVLAPQGMRLAPLGADAWNPAFDVTPSELVTAIITERGVRRPPYAFDLVHGGSS
jgi:methylthioribose-1-phosphate isomerase